MTVIRGHRLSIATYAGFAGLALLTLPSPLSLARAGLDASLRIGLHLAVRNGALFGRDIIFSYGPLGFLFFPLFVNKDIWLTSVLFIDVVHVAFFFCLAAFAISSTDRFGIVILGALAPVASALLGSSYSLAALVLVLSYLAGRGKRREYLIILAIVGALVFYTKADVGLFSFAVVLLANAWTFFKDRHLKSLMPVAVYATSLIMIGLLVTKSPGAFASFLLGYMQVAVGFGGAMAIDNMPSWVILFPLLCLTVLAPLVILSPDDKRTLLFLLSLPFLAITFKEGFVREDPPHVLIFLGAWSLFFLLLQCTLRFGRTRFAKILAVLMALLLLVSGVGLAGIYATWVSSGHLPKDIVVTAPMEALSFLGNVYNPSRFYNLLQTADLIVHPERAEIIFNGSVAALRETYHLSNNTLTVLGGHTVDVIPWDVSLVYANGLRWDPAPMFQSITAYTPYLDEANARHYESENSPEFVLYTPKSIDGRYPQFDEPRAFEALVCNYHIVGKDSQFLILKRRPNICGSHLPILESRATFGQTIETPADGQIIIAKVFIEQTLLGRTLSLFYKIPSVTVNLEFCGGENGTYRFVTTTGADGLLLQGGTVLEGMLIPCVSKLTFHTDGPGFYESTIRIQFYGVTGASGNDASMLGTGYRTPSLSLCPLPLGQVSTASIGQEFHRCFDRRGG